MKKAAPKEKKIKPVKLAALERKFIGLRDRLRTKADANKTFGEETIQEYLIFASGPVCRGYLDQTVSRKSAGVCGAASTAAAINIVREGMKGWAVKSWPAILYEQFNRRLKIQVNFNGRLSSQKVGNNTILKTLNWHKHIEARTFLEKQHVKSGNRVQAWESIKTALREKCTALLFHTRNHYVLIAGYAEPRMQEGRDRTEDELEQCMIFSARAGQAPKHGIRFTEVIKIIGTSRGMYKIMRVAFNG